MLSEFVIKNNTLLLYYIMKKLHHASLKM